MRLMNNMSVAMIGAAAIDVARVFIVFPFCLHMAGCAGCRLFGMVAAH